MKLLNNIRKAFEYIYLKDNCTLETVELYKDILCSLCSNPAFFEQYNNNNGVKEIKDSEYVAHLIICQADSLINMLERKTKERKENVISSNNGN